MTPRELALTKHRSWDILKQLIQDVLALKTLASNDIELRKELVRIRAAYDILVNVERQMLSTSPSQRNQITLELHELEALKAFIEQDIAHAAPLPIPLVEKTTTLLKHLQTAFAADYQKPA